MKNIFEKSVYYAFIVSKIIAEILVGTQVKCNLAISKARYDSSNLLQTNKRMCSLECRLY